VRQVLGAARPATPADPVEAAPPQDGPGTTGG
jgi:hypothetical protein